MKTICVFLGANYGETPLIKEDVYFLAESIVKNNLDLVYGGAQVGLMGFLADTVLSLGGKVTGVIPVDLFGNEIAHSGLTKLHYVDSMQARKKMMFNLSDAFIVLPGGLGTLEEAFEIWNAGKLGLHNKPIGFLNTNGFFDNLFAFLDGAMEHGFLKKDQFSLVQVSKNPRLLISNFLNRKI